MLKRTLKKLLQETTDKLNLVLLENRQLKERLAVFENQNNEEEINNLIVKIDQLTQENEDIRATCEIKYKQFEEEIKELEERNNLLLNELNQLKGEHFDTQRYAEDLKKQLYTTNSTRDLILNSSQLKQKMMSALSMLLT